MGWEGIKACDCMHPRCITGRSYTWGPMGRSCSPRSWRALSFSLSSSAERKEHGVKMQLPIVQGESEGDALRLALTMASRRSRKKTPARLTYVAWSSGQTRLVRSAPWRAIRCNHDARHLLGSHRVELAHGDLQLADLRAPTRQNARQLFTPPHRHARRHLCVQRGRSALRLPPVVLLQGHPFSENGRESFFDITSCQPH